MNPFHNSHPKISCSWPTTICAQSNADAKAKRTNSKKTPSDGGATTVMLRRMRWMSDGDGRWELDTETLVTMEGTACPVPGDPLPLCLSRGPVSPVSSNSTSSTATWPPRSSLPSQPPSKASSSTTPSTSRTTGNQPQLTTMVSV
jgi:hypothetical protein